MRKIKETVATILEFTTGLGFYGLGLLAGAVGAFFIGWPFVAAGLTGAFVHKNYAAIVEHFKNIVK